MFKTLLKKATMTLPVSSSTTVMELVDGRTEKLYFKQVKPTEFTVSDSEFTLKSGIKVDLDIQNVNLEATSEVLWPGQKVIVRGGIQANGEAIKGQVTIPIGKTIDSGVQGETWLYWTIETPDGTLKNKKAIHMVGTVKGLPPQDSEFTSSDVIPLFDQQGNHKATIYNCCQSN